MRIMRMGNSFTRIDEGMNLVKFTGFDKDLTEEDKETFNTL